MKRVRKTDNTRKLMARVTPSQWQKIEAISVKTDKFVAEMVREWIDSLPDPDRELSA
jgi:hypothetical protein